MALKDIQSQSVQLSGSQNRDFDKKSIKPGDFINALNYRNRFTENGIDGSGENLSANVLVPFTLPAGTNKCVGKMEDAKNNCVYYWVWNSNDDHSLLRYTPQNTGNGLIEVVLQTEELELDENVYINGANVVGSLLYWNNPTGHPQKVNVEKAVNAVDKRAVIKLCFGEPKDNFVVDYSFFRDGLPSFTFSFSFIGGDPPTKTEVIDQLYDTLLLVPGFTTSFDVVKVYGNYVELTSKIQAVWTIDIVITGVEVEQAWYIPMNYYGAVDFRTIDLGKWPSWCDPKIFMWYDPSRMSNNIKGSAYQFMVKYYYDDLDYSAVSPISELAVQSAQIVDDLLNTENNVISIYYDDHGRLFTNRDIVRGVEIFVRFTNTDKFKSVVYLYDYELTGTYNFYNNGSYTAIPDSEAVKPYDNIPIQAETQELVNNTLFLGNGLYGYDNEPININAAITWKDPGIDTYSISGKIIVKDIYTDVVQTFGTGPTANRIGDRWVLPQPGFTVYLAGQNADYKTVTTQNGTDQEFTISGIPDGSYIVRIASDQCSDGSTWGNWYDTSSGTDFQNTSTFVRGTSATPGKRELVVTVDGANVTLAEDFIVDYLFEDPNNSSYPLVSYGYVLDNNSVYNSSIRDGLGMDYATVEFDSSHLKQYRVTNIVVNPGDIVVTIDGGTPVGYAISDVVTIYNAFTGAPVVGTISATTLTTITLTPTTAQPLSLGDFSLIQKDGDTEVNNATAEIDHNGFYYLKIETSQFVADVGTGDGILQNAGGTYSVAADTLYSEVISSAITGSGFGGNRSPEAAILTLSSLVKSESTSVLTALLPAPSLLNPNRGIFIGNTNAIIHSTYRTNVTGKIINQVGTGISNVVVAFEHTGRSAVTNSAGEYSIQVYAKDSDAGVVRRIGDILVIGNNSDFLLLSYPNDSFVVLSITPFTLSGSPQYNNTNPFVVDNIVVQVDFAQYSFPKHGSKQVVGIVYMDRLNRNSFVSTNSQGEIYVPFYTEGSPDYYLTPYVTLSIYHRPPIWATHYQIVRTKDNTYNSYIQLPINDVKYIERYNEDGTPVLSSYGSANVKYLEIDTKTLEYYADQVRGSVLAYTFQPGDRLRFIKESSGDFYDEFIDIMVIGQDGSTVQLEYKASDPELTIGSVVELYNPKKTSEDKTYYEMSECYEVGDQGLETRFHMGKEQDQSSSDPNGVPAIITLTHWDTYLRERNYVTFVTTTPTDRPGVFETDLLSDINSVTAQSIGRVNAVVPANTQKRLETDIPFSLRYLPDTNINGLSSFELLNHASLPYNFGPLMKLKNNDNVMLAICKDKAFSVYVDKGVIQTQTGEIALTTTDKVIGAIRDLNGTHGTVNPESVAIDEGVIFWWDAYRGEVCQYAGNAIEVVSRFNMSNDFARKGALGILADRTTYKVIGEIHKQFSEYIISFCPISVNGVSYPAETLVYNYQDNGWKGNYSFIPEMMCGIGVNMISFKNGALWLHKINTLKNNFYGVQYDTEVEFVINLAGPTDKNFESMSVESLSAPNFPVITTPPSDLNLAGQETELLEADFELTNNSYFASFFMNKLTPNFDTPVEALIDGEPIQGQYLVVKLKKTSSSLFWIKTVEVYFNTNQLTN